MVFSDVWLAGRLLLGFSDRLFSCVSFFSIVLCLFVGLVALLIFFVFWFLGWWVVCLHGCFCLRRFCGFVVVSVFVIYFGCLFLCFWLAGLMVGGWRFCCVGFCFLYFVYSF